MWVWWCVANVGMPATTATARTTAATPAAAAASIAAGRTGENREWKYKTHIGCDPKVNRHIVGTNGTVLRDIQSSTGAYVRVPSPNDPVNQVFIGAASRDSLRAAKERVEEIIREHTAFAGTRSVPATRQSPAVAEGAAAQANLHTDVVRCNVQWTRSDFPRELRACIIGHEASCVRSIERKTGASIKFPDDACTEDIVFIEGSAEAILKAQAALKAFIEKIVSTKTEPFTHMVCIPLGSIESAHVAFTVRLGEMRRALVDKAARVEAGVFQAAEKAHLELFRLALWTPEDKEAAQRLMEEFVAPQLRSLFDSALGCRVGLKGLRVVDKGADAATATRVCVLLEQDEAGRRVVEVAARIHQAFVDAGLASTSKSLQIKGTLHAMVMSTKFLKGKKRLSTFDATRAMQLFGDVSFGTHRLQTVELRAFKGNPVAASVAFPS